MPNLAGLADRGACGPLRTVVPPVTAAAWSTIVTGLNPGRHGIFEFLVKDGAWDREVPVSARMRRGATLWDEVGAAGGRSIVLNMPVTYPPASIEGEMVSGFLTPPGAERISWPHGLAAELDARFGPYPLHIREVYAAGRVDAILDELFRELDHRGRVCEYMNDSRPWNLFCLHLWGPDRLQHELWHVFDPTHSMHDPAEAKKHLPRIREYFARLDRLLGELFGFLGERDHGMIVSDHGFGPIEHYLCMNLILLATGFLELRSSAAVRLKRLVLRLGFSPLNLYRLAAAIGLGRLRLSKGFGQRQALVAPLARLFLSLDDVDWSRTRAYSRGNYGQIYVNTAGREHGGVVPEGEGRDGVLRELECVLREVEAPDGGALFGEILRREQLHEGPWARWSPDLVALPADMRHKALGTFDFSMSHLTQRVSGNSGDHRLDGMLLLAGDRVCPGPIEGAGVADVFPTVLHLLGIGSEDRVDGAVLTRALREGEAAEHEAPSGGTQLPRPRSRDDRSRAIRPLRPDEARVIREALRGVGYWS